MTLEEFDALCRDLPGAEMVVQWGQSHVYKIGGKVFAIGRGGGDGSADISLKTSEVSFEALTALGKGHRAPYLPRGGWIRLNGPAMDPGEPEALIRGSFAIVAAGLPKARRPPF